MALILIQVKKHIFIAISIVLLLCGLHFPAVGSNPLDSLERALNRSGPDTTRVNVLNELAYATLYLDVNKSAAYGDAANKLAARIGFDKGLGNSYMNLGNVSIMRQDYVLAVEQYFRSLGIYESIDDSLRMAKAMAGLGVIYQSLGNTDKAQEYYALILKMRMHPGSSNQDKKLLAGTQYNWAATLFDIKEYDRSAQLYEQSLERWRGLRDTVREADVLRCLAKVYAAQKQPGRAIAHAQKALDLVNSKHDDVGKAFSNYLIGEQFEKLGERERALQCYRRALEFAQVEKNPGLMAKIKAQLGKLLCEDGNCDLGIPLILESAELYSKEENPDGEAGAIFSVAEIYLREGKKAKAAEYLRKAETIYAAGLKPKGALKCYEKLAEIHEQNGDFKAAIRYQKQFKALNDSIFREEELDLTAQANLRYQAEKKEREIALLQKENDIRDIEVAQLEVQQRNLALGFGGLLLLIVLAGLLWWSRVRSKRRAILHQLKQERFKDVLEALENERKRIAQDLHDDIGQLLSAALLNVSSLEDFIAAASQEGKMAYKNSVKLIENAWNSARAVSHRTMPGALIRLGLIPAIRDLADSYKKSGKVNVELKTESWKNRLPEKKEIALFRILQELMSNAVRHGEAREVVLRFDLEEGYAHLMMQDNGKGFDVEKVKRSSGIGWSNVMSRTEMLEGEIRVDSSPGAGTRVDLRFPV